MPLLHYIHGLFYCHGLANYKTGNFLSSDQMDHQFFYILLKVPYLWIHILHCETIVILLIVISFQNNNLLAICFAQLYYTSTNKISKKT